MGSFLPEGSCSTHKEFVKIIYYLSQVRAQLSFHFEQIFQGDVDCSRCNVISLHNIIRFARMRERVNKFMARERKRVGLQNAHAHANDKIGNRVHGKIVSTLNGIPNSGIVYRADMYLNDTGCFCHFPNASQMEKNIHFFFAALENGEYYSISICRI